MDCTTNKVFMYEILYNNCIPNNILFSVVNSNLDLFILSQLINFYKNINTNKVLYSINCFYETYYNQAEYINKLLGLYKNLYIELIELSQFTNTDFMNKNRVLIDDFGTKNNNLDKLKTAAFAIKIDRVCLDYSINFLKELIENIKFHNSIPIFEKIETKAELDKAKLSGCNYIQGFYFRDNPTHVIN